MGELPDEESRIGDNELMENEMKKKEAEIEEEKRRAAMDPAERRALEKKEAGAREEAKKKYDKIFTDAYKRETGLEK